MNAAKLHKIIEEIRQRELKNSSHQITKEYEILKMYYKIFRGTIWMSKDEILFSSGLGIRVIKLISPINNPPR